MCSLHSRKYILAAVTLNLATAAARAGDDYQVHGLYLGEAPSGETNWSDDVRGLAHDATHWLISQEQNNFDDSPSACLWRIPVTSNLSTVSVGSPGVTRLVAEETFGLGGSSFGDPCVYRFNNVDYIVLPVSFGPNSVWAAVIASANLTYITRTLLPVLPVGVRCQDTIAVDPAGVLYGFREGDELIKFSVDWPALQESGELNIQYVGPQILYAEDGVSDPAIGYVSGHEFTSDGRYLYVVTSDNGIHIFDALNWRRVLHSTNGSGHFDFQWDSPDEVPMGLTVWDLDAIPAWTGGQLHVIVKDFGEFTDDDVFLKHYTMSIRVRAGADPPGDGRPGSEFPTVTAAVNLAWPGSEIRIIHGNFDEALTINKRVRLRSVGGITRIGG